MAGCLYKLVRSHRFRSKYRVASCRFVESSIPPCWRSYIRIFQIAKPREPRRRDRPHEFGSRHVGSLLQRRIRALCARDGWKILQEKFRAAVRCSTGSVKRKPRSPRTWGRWLAVLHPPLVKLRGLARRAHCPPSLSAKHSYHFRSGSTPSYKTVFPFQLVSARLE